jgi:hypothetical protein
MGAVFAAVVDAGLDESTLSKLLAESRRNPSLAERLAMMRIKGREVGRREGERLLAIYAEKSRAESSDRLLGAALEEALAASLAAPSIDRAARGNEGSRLMLGGLSGRGDGRDLD